LDDEGGGVTDAINDFLRDVDAVAAQATDEPRWTLYERLKQRFHEEFPGANYEQYVHAMQRIARAAGV
jgi:pterin-4a-carbinolamine dehydratase